MPTIEADMFKMIRGHLHFEMRQLKNIIQEIYARGNLSEEQDGLCLGALIRLDYLLQVVAGEQTPA